MILNGWRAWLRRVFHFSRHTHQADRPARPCPRRQLPRPWLEILEDRTVFATNITILPGAAGAGNLDHFLSATHGTLTTADDPGDTAATLSVGALQGVGPGTPISITADATIHFNDIGALNLQTGTGVNAGFTTTTGALDFANVFNTVSTGGGALHFSAGTDLTVANLNTKGGDVSLTAGTAGAGNLQFENILTNGSGNLSFQATNAAGGTITQAGAASVASGLTINATATGDISVHALRGTTVGVTSSTGSISSAGTSHIQASAQLTLAAATGITVNTLAASLEASNSTSGDVTITQAASPAQTLTISGSGVVNNANSGAVTLDNLGASITVSGNVQSSNGVITLAATDLQINGAINSGTARTILTTSVAGKTIDLGTNPPGTVGLTGVELGHVTASVLQIGSAAAGVINVSDPVNYFNSPLTLINNDAITEAAAGGLNTFQLRVSSPGPVTLASTHNFVDVLAADTTNSFSFSDGTNTLSIGTVDGVTGITSVNSDITLTNDILNINQPINAGTGRVTLQPFTSTLTIDLGTTSVVGGTYGLTDTELNEVTAGVLRIGSSGFTGNIMVSAAINPTHVGALSLITTSLGTITQGVGDTISVNSGAGGLAVQANTSVALNEQNDVGSLAAAITGAGNHFIYTDANGFAVSTVDGVAGISTATGTTETVVLNAGGAVDQLGANITTQNLLLLGTGGYDLTDSGNDVATLAANVTNSVSYTDANDLTVGTVIDPATLTATIGVTTSGADISITASAVTSGTTLTVTNAIDTTNDANITLNANLMSLLAAVNAHAGIVTLLPTTGGRAIDLGTNTDTTHLGLLQTDLANVTAGVLRIGDLGTGGSITVTAPITDATTGWTTLSLLTSGSNDTISQNVAATLTVTNLNAAGRHGVTLNENNVVSTLAGATNFGAFSFTDATSLTLDNVDSGLGGGFGSGIITEAQAVSLTVNVLNDSLTINQQIDTTHSFVGAAGGGANINLSADNMALNNNSPSSTINAGTGGILTLTPFTPANTIAVGGAAAAGTLGIDDNDLTNVTAKVVRVGSAAQLGAISIDGTINTHAGYNSLDLIATGAITQTTGSIAVANLALQADAGIGSAGAIQVVGPINVAFHNVTSNNVQISSTGALTIAAVDTLDGTAGNEVANLAAGGTVTLTASSPLTFAVNTISAGTITATTTETASEDTAGANMPLPPPDDDLTVNSGVTVESTGGDVDLTSGDSIVLQPGSTVKSDTGAVNLMVGVGDNDNDATLNLSGTISTAQDFTVTSPGDVCVGNINDPGHTVTITSTGGAILDCDTGETEPGSPTGDFSNGASVDITADTLNLSASTGIGIVSGMGVGPLETQVNTLGADTSTGGIFITNGVTSAVTLNIAGTDGVQVTGASGDIQLVNQGSLNVVTAGDKVRTEGGNITITTTAGDINTGGNQNAVVINPFNLNLVSLNAAGNVNLGVSGASGNVVGGGPIRVIAGGSITIDNGTNALAGGGGGDVTMIAGGNISVLHTVLTGAKISTTSGSGNVNLTTGVGGVFTLDSGAGGSVSSSGGNITISADDMVINDPINAGAGIVTLQQASTTTRDIDVGGGTTANDLGLSDTELDQVTAGILRIGRTDNTGSLTVTAPVTTHAGYSTLSLLTGGGVSETGTGNITVTSLAVQAAGDVSMDTNASTVTNLAGTTTNAAFKFTNSADLTIAGPIDGVSGLNAGSGTVTITVSLLDGTLNVNQPVIGTAGEPAVELIADNLNIDTTTGSINSGTGTTILEPFTTSRMITVGTKPGGTLGVTQVELSRITAAPLILGNGFGDTTGNIQVTAAIAAPAGWNTLGLVTQGTVTQGAGFTLTVTNLDVRGDAGVTLTENGNTVTNLEGRALGAAAAFSLTNSGSLTITNLPKFILVGIETNGGAIAVKTINGDLTVNNDVGAGAASIDLAAGGADSLLTNNAGISNSGGNTITLTADRMALGSSPAESITAAGSARVVLTAFSASQPINLGPTADPNGSLNLSNDELNTAAVTGGVLQIGSGIEGDVTIGTSITINVQAVTFVLTIDTAGAILGSGDIAVDQLRLSAGNGVNLPGDNNLNTLAGVVTGGSQGFLFNNFNSGGLTIGTVDGINGITTSNGAITVSATSDSGTPGLTVAQNVSAGTAPVTLTADSAGSLFTNNAAVMGGSAVITADRMTLDAGTINVGTGATNIVSLIPSTFGRAIDLGTNGNTNDLGLVQADLNSVTAGILRIRSAFGTTVHTDSITITAPITDVGTGWTTLSLITAEEGTLSQNAGATLTVVNLQAAGLNRVTLNENNVVSKLAGASVGAFSFVDTTNLTVDNVDSGLGLGFGIGINGGGPIDLTLNGAGDVLTINQAIDTTHFGDPGTDVNLTADSMSLGAAVNGGTAGIVTLQPLTATRVIDLGTKSAGNLGLTGAELTNVSAGVLTIGSTTDTGGITVSNAIDAAGHYATLALDNSGAVTQTALAGLLKVPNLAILGATSVAASATPLKTAVGTFAASVGAGGLFVANTGALTIGSVNGVNGLTATGGTMNVSASGPLTVAQNVQNAGAITLSALAASPPAPGDNLTVNGGVTINATAGNVTLNGGDSLSVPVGAVVQASGTATLNEGTKGNGGTLTLTGKVTGTTATLQGGAGNDTFTINTTGSSPLSISGAAGNDVFNLTPSTTTPMTVDGGTNSGGAGDTFNFEALSLPVATAPGKYTAAGRQAVTFSNVQGIGLNDAGGVSSFYGPDTADRSALSGLSAQQRFVQVLYLDALGRAGSVAELNGWVNFMNASGSSQAVIAGDIERSQEGRTHLVRTWYGTFLGRPAGGGEEQGWVNLLLAGQTEEQVLSGILGSQEFFNHAQTLVNSGTANERFVQALYQLLLNRTASSAEVGGWQNGVATFGDQAVALVFLGTTEFRTDLAEAYYDALLHRPADAGRFGWVNSGLDATSMRVGFESGSEFFNNG